jgi:hypothetical protein
VNAIFKDKLIILRQRIPIGLRDGLVLIEKVNGDLEKAEEQFKADMVTLAINKTGVTPEVALSHLTKSSFDITLAIKSIRDELKSIDDARYTITELILRNRKDKKEDALFETMHAVEEKFKLKRESWLSFDGLNALPTEVCSFMAIMEWLNYEDYEGYDYALSFNFNLVIEHIKDQLALTDLVNTLQHANNIKTIIYLKNKTAKDFQNFINAGNELRQHEEFKKCEQDYIRQRPLLIERLYDYVKSNSAYFP